MDYPRDFPTKNKKRGERRAKFQTICKRVKNYVVVGLNENLLELRAKLFANNRKKCSCWMCRNPRHVFHGVESTLTIQERRALQDDGE